jgi:hypothetical protein
MVLKSPPQIFYTDGTISNVIGSPEDFHKNRDSGKFLDATDLSIPAMQVDSIAGSSQDISKSRVSTKPAQQ